MFHRPALAVAAMLALAAPAQAAPDPSFDCAKAGTTVEKAICADVELARLDKAMAARHAALKARDKDHDVLAGQRDWIRQRNGCAEQSAALTQCVAAQYMIRITVLDGALGSTALASDPLADQCSEAMNTLEINGCIDTHLQWAEAALNIQTAKLKGQFTDMKADMGNDFGALDALAHVRDSLADWRATRCALVSMHMAGGTGASTLYLSCALEVTQDLLADVTGLLADSP